MLEPRAERIHVRRTPTASRLLEPRSRRPPAGTRLGDLAAVGAHGEDVRDDEDADTPGEGDPDVGADWLLL